MSEQSEKSKVAPTRPVGPDYRAESQKPAATVSTPVDVETVTILPQTPQLIALLSCVTLSTSWKHGKELTWAG